jgi:hypothetical protein
MKMNLKRALKLRKELEAHLKSPNIPMTVSIPLIVEVDIAKVLDEGRAKLAAAIMQTKTLSAILAGVRVAIAKANVEAGIEEILADLANLERQVRIMALMGSETPSLEMIMAEVAMAKKALETPVETRYGSPAREKHLPVYLMTTDAVETHQAKLIDIKREREALEDKRAFINSSVTIEIPDDNAELLRKLGII